jgi:Protein of unknown function (DUF1688)
MTPAQLLSSAAIRERCTNILSCALAGESRWFTVDLGQLDPAAEQVASVTRRRYPDLVVPYHSRWRHFEAGGVDRAGSLFAPLISSGDLIGAARSRIDLAVVAVLLDAGAGGAWRYTDAATGFVAGRSEGLGIASLRAFEAGLFSSDARQPLRVDGLALAALDVPTLAAAFQVRADNPLLGLEGRVGLLKRLGEAMHRQSDWFGESARPGALFDALLPAASRTLGMRIEAHDILSALLQSMGPIWPQGARLGGVALGDTWPHPQAGGVRETAGWVPFHKLSQWLSYSLLEPFEAAGVAVGGLDALTGLAEYRNGGLLVDTDVIRARDATVFDSPLAPGAEPIVEWRALTVALIDLLAPRVRAQLGSLADNLSLAAILEGGTWAAGRELAQARRGGEPPFRVISDGTVF